MRGMGEITCNDSPQELDAVTPSSRTHKGPERPRCLREHVVLVEDVSLHVSLARQGLTGH